MRIEVRFRECAETIFPRGLPKALEIANQAEVNRHTIARLLNKKQVDMKLNTLEKLANWLAGNGYKGKLPEDLIAERPSSVWQAMAATGRVVLLVGEYLWETEAGTNWIHQRDAFATYQIVDRLSDSAVIPKPPRIQIDRVPFYRNPDGTPSDDDLARDAENAKRILERKRKLGRQRTILMIGSQLVNYSLENWVASIWNCVPFVVNRQTCSIPFYLSYRKGSYKLPSCFGGHEHPAGGSKQPDTGLYYRVSHGWKSIAWKQNERDAGSLSSQSIASADQWNWVC